MDLFIFLLMIIIPTIAQTLVQTSYSKYKNIQNDNNISGFEVARKILDENDLKDIYIVETTGKLTDHYDPKRKVIRLSKDIYHGTSIASLAVAAHECGHAIQDKEGYLYMRIRSLIFPVVNFATTFAYLVIFIGLIAEAVEMVLLGIGLVGTGLIFQLVTLPVEINASNIAKKEISKLNIASNDEQEGVSKMLISAASTYVAGVLSSALELVRLVLIIFNNEKRR